MQDAMAVRSDEQDGVVGLLDHRPVERGVDGRFLGTSRGRLQTVANRCQPAMKRRASHPDPESSGKARNEEWTQFPVTVPDGACCESVTKSKIGIGIIDSRVYIPSLDL